MVNVTPTAYTVFWMGFPQLVSFAFLAFDAELTFDNISCCCF